MASGGSVVAIKYDGGVLMACDTLLSYGSLAKQPNVPRIRILGNNSALAASGDYADFTAMFQDMDELIQEAHMDQDPEPRPNELFNYLHRTMYKKRCDFEPCINKFIFTGVDPKTREAFVSGCDSIGTRWTDACACAGMAAANCLPLLRRALEVKNGVLTRDEAMSVVHDCLRLIFYRECRAINRFQISDTTADGVSISEPTTLPTAFEYDGFSFEKTSLL